MAHGKRLRAGILIELRTFKPHLGLLIPFALIAGRQWQVLAIAAATTVAVIALSSIAVGFEVWPKFFAAIGDSMAMQIEGALPHNQMVSLSALLSTLGLSLEGARDWQIVLSIAVLFAVLQVWLRLGPCLLSGAALIAGCTLVTFHILGYDLVLLVPAISILAWDGYRRGWLRGERTSYFLLWIWPSVSGGVANVTQNSIGVGGSLLLFLLVLRRCQAMGQELDRPR